MPVPFCISLFSPFFPVPLSLSRTRHYHAVVWIKKTITDPEDGNIYIENCNVDSTLFVNLMKPGFSLNLMKSGFSLKPKFLMEEMLHIYCHLADFHLALQPLRQSA